MKILKKLPYISKSQQEIIIEAFIKFYNKGYEIALDCLHKTGLNITIERMLQFVFLVKLVQFVFLVKLVAIATSFGLLFFFFCHTDPLLVFLNLFDFDFDL